MKTMERSISPSKRTKTSPMANMMNTTAWLKRLTILPAERNREVLTSKTMTMAMSPTMTGRTPLSPERTFRHQAVTYSPRLSANTSDAAARALSSGRVSSGGGAVTTAPGGPDRHQAPAAVGSWTLVQASSAPLPPAGAEAATGLLVSVPVVMYSTRLWVSKSDTGPCATILPSRNTAIRSATSKTSLRL